MVNSEQFANRLQKIFDFYDISAATFAEAIDVGRSSISHILSGRNKPSLDFVMKVVQTYPEVELYWLLNGKGSFPPGDKKEHTIRPAEKVSEPSKTNSDPEMINVTVREKYQTPGKENDRKIKKIILLYEDGSFEAFENGNVI